MNVGAVFVALCMISVFGNVVAEDVKIYIGGDKYFIVDPGTPYIEIPINANVTAGKALGAMTLQVSVDDVSILSPFGTNNTEFVINADCDMDTGTLDRQNVTNGRSEFGVTCSNVGGDFTMIKVKYAINSSACGKKININLTLYNNDVSDFNGNSLSSITENGSVTIRCNATCCPSGTTCNTTTHLCQPTTITCYRDADNDNYTNNSDITYTNTTTCPTNYKNFSTAQDCNDNNASIHPGATEIYNNVEDNCNGLTDEGFCNNETHYNSTVCSGWNCNATHYCNSTSHLIQGKKANGSVCSANYECQNGNCFNNICRPAGWNCDNASSSYNATHYCNASNQLNTKKNMSESCSAGYECLGGSCNITCQGYVYYRDADNDGFGDSYNASNRYISLTDNGTKMNYNGSNYTKTGGDCNDTNANINPNATDIPNNGIDENCNSHDNMTYYRDADNDTYGNATNNQTSDTPLPGYITNASKANDCNDNDSTVNPGANETAYGIDGKDNNCNEIIDDCSPVNSSISATIYCNASGIMNYKKDYNATCSIDVECKSNNCTNGRCAGYLCYRDADNDGFGDVANFNVSTNATCPTGYVNNSNDCNDNNSAINPNTVWYFDYDSDGYGNTTNNVTSCTKPTGNWVLTPGDCNDNNASIHPGATEIYNNVDDNCNGLIDEGFCNNETHYNSTVCPGWSCDATHYCNSTSHLIQEKKESYKKSTSGGYTGVIELQPTQPPTPVTPKEFSGVPNENEGKTLTFNLGKEASGALVTAKVGDKTSTSTANANGTVSITLPGFGQGEITVSKTGFKTLTKTVTVYAGSLNITKISGEKYGDEFKFKVTTKDGSPVKDTTVNVLDKQLKTDANGIAKTTIKTMENLEASASAEYYKSASVSFEVKPIGTLKLEVPEKVKQGDIITIKVTDENKNPVANAKITINGIEQTADANGKIEYNVTTTSLTLKAEGEGYIPSEQTSVSVEAKIVCGNGKCEAGETKENCAIDCIVCGDNVCDKGESYENCPSDCKKPADNTLLIAAGILIVILLIAAYYFLVMRKKKGGEAEA